MTEYAAMPWSHRYVGKPVLTRLLNRLFGLRASEAHSGRRAFVMPGAALLLGGLVGQLALPGALDVGFHRLDVHFSVLFALLAILGCQSRRTP